MVKSEYRVGAHELLDQERRRTDFARRVFDGGLVDAGTRVGSRGRGG
jgi:hypothetical protein